MTLQNFDNEVAAGVFVAQAAFDIQNYFNNRMPGWQGEKLKDIILPGGLCL